MAELLFSLLLILLLVGQYVSSFTIGGRQVSSDLLGPEGFPRLVILLAIALLAGLTVRTIVGLRRQGQVPLGFDPGFLRRPFVRCLLALAAYAAALNLAGYALSTALFLFLVGRVTGYARNLALGLYALLLTGALVLVFGRMFAVPLPRGVGWLRELSYLVY